MDSLRQKRLFLLDMDGTIYLGDRLFPGTLPFLHHVQRIGGRAVYLTNNSSKSVDCYLEKLARMGIPASRSDFCTSAQVTVRYLQGQSYRKIYVFGTDSFRQQLEQAKLPVTVQPEADVDCLCMGFDTQLTFQKLEDACILLGRKVDYIAANPDWVCPTEFGYVPDCGSVAEMLFRATGRRPRFLGKPEPDMALLAMELAGASPQETILLGDRLYTDIACGKNAGIDAALLLSGEAVLADLAGSPVQPDYVFQDIQEFLDTIK